MAVVKKQRKRNKADAKADAREIEVIRLRVEGKTYQKIAEMLGYAHASGAHDAYKRAIAKERSESVGELRRLLDSRYELIWELGLEKGDFVACIKALTGKAKLHGLDAAIKVDVTSKLTDEEKRAKLKEIVTQILANGRRP